MAGDTDSQSPSKRKRSLLPTPPETSSPLKSEIPQTPATMRPTISSAFATPEDDDPGSPRTKVAYNFQGLHLEGGDGISKLDFMRDSEGIIESQEDGTAARKRTKILEREEPEIPETLRSFTISVGRERTVDPIILQKANQVTLHNNHDPVIFKGMVNRVKANPLQKAYPSINRLSDSTSRVPKKKKGSPPLFGAADASLVPEASTFTDPDQATLTWHDDEITGHDPSDPEDDGEGINGIGFKPTPAIAHARSYRRRQQMEAYRTREAREARERRNERRKATEAAKNSTFREESEAARKVRFFEN